MLSQGEINFYGFNPKNIIQRENKGHISVSLCYDGKKNITCACYSCVRYDVFNEYCECENVDFPLIAKLPVCSKQHLEIITYTADEDFILHHIADFGKTVFLTCKEAEKALERMKDE